MPADSQQNGQQRNPMSALAHQHNFRGLQKQDGPGDRARLLEVTVDSELEAPSDALRNLRAKDFPLANYDELADSFEVKGVQEILALLDEVRHPHPDSILQGPVREWAFNDPGESLEARTPEEEIVNESFLLGTYSRVTRGEDGFQQETSAKQTRESITVDEDNGGGKGGLRSRLPGL